MLSSMRMFVSVGCIVLSFAVELSSSHALMATGTAQRPEKEIVYCYFSSFRKDGRILVNMVEGASGKLYRVTPTTPVTMSGAVVGRKYLADGMPIILILRNSTDVSEIQVRQAGGK